LNEEVKKFQPIGKYSYPNWPARKYAQRFYSTMMGILKKDDDQSFIADDKLNKTDQDMISEIVTLPSYGGLMEELNHSIDDWLTTQGVSSKLVILPPGDDNFIEAWAQEHKCHIFTAPRREDLISASFDFEVVLPDNYELIVIPRLERWFLRHHNGLNAVQALLKAIQKSDVKCLIGCNSWAHQFLQKALNSQFILPDGIMFQSFDADRLKSWFTSMVSHSDKKGITFKSTKSGKNVLSQDKNDEFEDNFLKELSAESLGIPWIAWELWKEALNSESEDAQKSEGEKETTLWLTALDEFTLPNTDDQGALLTLHALLIHTELTIEELNSVLPNIEHTNVSYLLLNTGFVVQKENKALTCNIASYPSIRRALNSSGFPMDKL